MEKKEIVAQLQAHDCSVLSFPDRGPWGSSRYRGNCSGWIQAFLIWKYRVSKMLEVFAGSGTGYDVANSLIPTAKSIPANWLTFPVLEMSLRLWRTEVT